MAAIASSPPQTPTADADTDLASLSINSIIRLHPRERLFVRPLHWTPRHVDLLSCSFIHSTSSDALSRFSPPSSPNRNLNPSTRTSTSTTAHSDGEPRPSSIDNKHMTMLVRARSPSARAGALGVLLSNGPAPFERTVERLTFRFEGHRIPMDTVATFSRPQLTLPSGSALPMLAFLDPLRIHRSREASLGYLCCPPSSRPSNPTLRLYEKKLAQITPSNPLQDPYILAMLIALAQSQQRQYAQAHLLSTTQSFQVHVIVSNNKEKSHLVLYTADVPIVFLNRLATPHKRPLAAYHLDVHSVDIPYQPYPSFIERLTHAVAPPSPKRSWDSDPFDEDTRDNKRWKMPRRE